MGKWPLWLPIFTSSFNLMFLNIERYISIVYPIFHHTKVTRKKVLLCLPIVWVLGLFEVCLIGSGIVSVNGACDRGQGSHHLANILVNHELLYCTSFLLTSVTGTNSLWTHDNSSEEKCEIKT